MQQKTLTEWNIWTRISDSWFTDFHNFSVVVNIPFTYFYLALCIWHRVNTDILSASFNLLDKYNACTGNYH